MGQTHSLSLSLAPLVSKGDFTVSMQTLVDATPERAADVAQRFGWRPSSSDWRTVVEDPMIDVIDIVALPRLHEEIALAALAA